ncbi:uncharacterized protein LOC119385890 [Rhipicephalus sanguineus]|uniref:uncharacterized protein LOC119385890 n=1 Tax=Rhipicephalus sanguineus TaxID=34632 RepID=UPI0020C569C7|nr:uncharacterized protein LOC119385890 [Rhipicephalus sanguineus]
MDRNEICWKANTSFFKKIQGQVELVAGTIAPGPKQDEFFDWVERGTHAILYERNFQDATLARRFAERGRCRFRRARQSLNLQPLAMILWKGLKPELKKTITTVTRRASEMALPERPMQPFIFNSSRCYAEDPDDAAAYRIEDLQGAFVSLVLGLSLSLAGFMTEIFLKKTQSIDQTSRAGDQGGPKVGNHFDAS